MTIKGIMTAKEDKERFEQNFRDIFSKLNRAATNKTLIIIFTIFTTFCTVIMALGYKDLQDSKQIANDRHIEVLDKINDLKILIVKKQNTKIPLSIVQNGNK